MWWDASADQLKILGTIDITGTANLDAVDIDGAVQIDGTVSVGVDGTGKDVTFFGDTADRKMLWDESEDKFVLGTTTATGASTDALTAILNVFAFLFISCFNFRPPIGLSCY